MPKDKKKSIPSKTTGQFNVFAVLSLIFGIAFFIPFGPILAILFGFIALNQISKNSEEGKGLAIAGIILGFLWIFMILMILLFIILAVSPAFMMLLPLA